MFSSHTATSVLEKKKTVVLRITNLPKITQPRTEEPGGLSLGKDNLAMSVGHGIGEVCLTLSYDGTPRAVSAAVRT